MIRLILLAVPIIFPPPFEVVDVAELNRVLNVADGQQDSVRYVQWIYRDADGTIRDWRWATEEPFDHPANVVARRVIWTETFFDPEVDDRWRLPECRRWRLGTFRPPWQGARRVDWGDE